MQEEAVRQRLDSLIRTSGSGYAALSRMIGRNSAYLQQFIKRGVPRRLAESDRHQLARHFGVSERLLGAPGDPQPAPTLAPCSSEAGSLLMIPYLEDRAATNARPETFALDRRFAGLPHTATPDSLLAWRVRGDSMAPTLSDGDNVLIEDRGLAKPGDGIYVIQTEAGVMVKRISIHPVTCCLSIISDNAAYPAFGDCDPAAIRIIGRVIWAGRRIA
jgi:SOS-response transcriptional repressor LexA